MLTSRSNPKIKFLESLRKSKERKASNLFLVEGEREISRAGKIETLVFHESTQLVERIGRQGAELIRVSKELLGRISVRGEMIAIGKQYKRALSSMKGTFFVALVGVEKPGNIGAILRTCDGCGIDGVLLVDSLSDHYHPNAIRASLGASFSLKIATCTSEQAFAFIEKKELQLVVASPDTDKSYFEENLSGPVMIALGQEDKGLPESWMKGTKISIPMKGICDSLNVSVAAGIVLYEALRQHES